MDKELSLLPKHVENGRIPISYIKTLVKYLIEKSNTDADARKLAVEILKLYLYPNQSNPDDFFRDELDEYMKKATRPGAWEKGKEWVVSRFPRKPDNTPSQQQKEKEHHPNTISETDNSAQESLDTSKLKAAIEKSCQEARAQCIAALLDLDEAKHDYEHWKNAVKDYQENVLNLVNPFLKMMDNLICFAGCCSQDMYEDFQSILHNAQEDICIGLLPDMWGEKINAENLFRISADLLKPPGQAVPRNAYPELEEVDIKENSAEKKSAYQKAAEEARKLAKKYRMQSNIYSGRIKEDERTLDYILLLRELLGVIEKIQSGFPETAKAEWAVSVCEELTHTVENYRCVTDGMRFTWVYPHGKPYLQNQSIRLEFRAAGVNCPGLFYSLLSENGTEKLVCVIRGYRK